MVDAVGHFRVTGEGYEYCPPVDVERAACPNGLEEMKTALAALSTCSQRELVARWLYIELLPVLGRRTGRTVYLLAQKSQAGEAAQIEMRQGVLAARSVQAS